MSESLREASGQTSQSLLEPTPPEGPRQRPRAVKGEGHAWHEAAQGTALDTGGLDRKLTDTIPTPPAPTIHCWAHPHFCAGEKRVFRGKRGSSARTAAVTPAPRSGELHMPGRGPLCAEQNPKPGMNRRLLTCGPWGARGDTGPKASKLKGATCTPGRRGRTLQSRRRLALAGQLGGCGHNDAPHSLHGSQAGRPSRPMPSCGATRQMARGHLPVTRLQNLPRGRRLPSCRPVCQPQCTFQRKPRPPRSAGATAGPGAALLEGRREQAPQANRRTSGQREQPPWSGSGDT